MTRFTQTAICIVIIDFFRFPGATGSQQDWKTEDRNWKNNIMTIS